MTKPVPECRQGIIIKCRCGHMKGPLMAGDPATMDDWHKQNYKHVQADYKAHLCALCATCAKAGE